MTNTEFEHIGASGSGGAGVAKKKRRPILIVTLVVLGLILAGVLGVVGIYGKTVNDALTSVQRDPNLLPDTEDTVVVPPDDSWQEPDPSASADPSADPSTSQAPSGEASPSPEGLNDDLEAEPKAVAPNDPAAKDISAPYSGDIPDTGAINVLVIGSDSRGSDRGRSDVFMVVHVAADRSRVDLISIPRDYWVAIPGRGTAKINAAYSWGGAPLAVQTVQGLLGIKIDHVAVTDFTGFTNAIDQLGGVTVNNRVASKSGSYNWPKGSIRLNSGKEALTYVRQRYTLPRGDFDRGERQRAVLQAVAKQIVSGGVLANPGKLNSVLSGVGSNFRVDAGLTNDKLLSLGSELARAGGARNVHSQMVPTAGFGTSRGGQSYVRVDRGGISSLGDQLRNDRMG